MLSASSIGKIFTQEAINQKTSYPPECNKINFNAGYGSSNRKYINYNNQDEWKKCVLDKLEASVGCGMVKNFLVGCDIRDAPSRPPLFDNECAKHMIEKGKNRFKYVSEIQSDPCLNKYKDNSYYPLGSATGTMTDKAANIKGKVISF